MNRRIKLLLVIALSSYAFTHVVVADEHPGAEHPGQEHPKESAGTKEQAAPQTKAAVPSDDGQKAGEETTTKGKPKKKKGKTSDKPTSWNRGQVEKELVAFIDSEKGKTDGVFVVKDERMSLDRKLTLEKIHTDKIVRLSDGTSFVCADFKDASGDKVDVDFFMTSTGTGGIQTVNKVQVHKINGQPRYTYVKKSGVWVQTAVN